MNHAVSSMPSREALLQLWGNFYELMLRGVERGGEPNEPVRATFQPKGYRQMRQVLNEGECGEALRWLLDLINLPQQNEYRRCVRAGQDGDYLEIAAACQAAQVLGKFPRLPPNMKAREAAKQAAKCIRSLYDLTRQGAFYNVKDAAAAIALLSASPFVECYLTAGRIDDHTPKRKLIEELAESFRATLSCNFPAVVSRLAARVFPEIQDEYVEQVIKDSSVPLLKQPRNLE